MPETLHVWPIVLLTLLTATEAPAQPRSQAPWTTVTVFNEGELIVRLRVRQRASLADENWIGFDFENRSNNAIVMWPCDMHYHIDSERYNLRTGVLISSGGLAFGGCVDLFPDAWEDGTGEPIVLAPGVTTVFESPSDQVASLGLPGRDGLLVSADVHFRLVLRQRDQFGVPFTFEWVDPSEVELAELRDRLRRLLKELPSPHSFHRFHRRVHVLLSELEIGGTLTSAELLSALDRAKDPLKRKVLAEHIARTRTDDPVVAEYYRTAIREKNGKAIHDLAVPPGFWQDDFLEPLLAICEADGWNLGYNAMQALVNHRDRWKDSARVPSRLSAAVMEAYPVLSRQPDELSGRELRSDWKQAVRILVQTGDPQAYSTLCPFLDCRMPVANLDRWVTPVLFPSSVPPLRVCDVALDAVLTLTGYSVGQVYKEAAAERGFPSHLDVWHSAPDPPRVATSGLVPIPGEPPEEIESKMNELRDEVIAELKQTLD
jgi:hypothetical protein